MKRITLRLGAFAIAGGVFLALAGAGHATSLGSIGRGLDTALRQQFIQERTPTLAPMGHVMFCLQQPRECRASRKGAEVVSLTPSRLAELRSINSNFNHSVRAVKDRASGIGDTWKIAVNEGDCEDFALAKRKMLLRRGWSPSALRIGVATTPSGVGHAVLVVRTSSGDLVLDNRHDRILPWRATDLRWQKIQSAQDPRRWFAL